MTRLHHKITGVEIDIISTGSFTYIQNVMSNRVIHSALVYESGKSFSLL